MGSRLGKCIVACLKHSLCATYQLKRPENDYRSHTGDCLVIGWLIVSSNDLRDVLAKVVNAEVVLTCLKRRVRFRDGVKKSLPINQLVEGATTNLMQVFQGFSRHNCRTLVAAEEAPP